MHPRMSSDQARQVAALVDVPPDATALGARFRDAGHELALVGGSVRDALLGIEQADLDFATSAAPPATERLLRGWADDVWDVGSRFGTISARKGSYRIEVTTYRSDAYTAGSRHPDVTFTGDLDADLSRRDFTCNAMAVRLPEPAFVDPFGGLADLRRRMLRTPIEPATSFGDDPLRMVRLCRFAATLDAEPDPATLAAATAMSDEVRTISAERVRDELCKLVVAPAQARGLDLLCATGLADHILPELPALQLERDPGHHHKDVYLHTLKVVEQAQPASDVVLRLAALLHDIGKPATRELHPGGQVTFHHHEVVGARMARKRLKALKLPGDVVEQVTDLVRLHLRFHGYADDAWTDSAVRRYVHDAGSAEQLRRLNALTRADVTTGNKARARRLWAAMDDLEDRIAALEEEEELRALRPPIDGNAIMGHLGIAPGPLVGEAWRMLLDARIEAGPMSQEQGYALLDRWAAERGLTD